MSGSIFLNGPLHFAINNNDLKIAENLIAMGACLQGSLGFCKSTEMMDLLLSNGENIQGKTLGNDHCVIFVKSGRYDLFEHAISNGASIKSVGSNGGGLLHYVRDIDDDKIQSLVEKGAELDYTSSACPCTPLVWAVAGKKQNVVRELIRRGASLNPVTTGVKTAGADTVLELSLKTMPGGSFIHAFIQSHS